MVFGLSSPHFTSLNLSRYPLLVSPHLISPHLTSALTSPHFTRQANQMKRNRIEPNGHLHLEVSVQRMFILSVHFDLLCELEVWFEPASWSNVLDAVQDLRPIIARLLLYICQIKYIQIHIVPGHLYSFHHHNIKAFRFIAHTELSTASLFLSRPGETLTQPDPTRYCRQKVWPDPTRRPIDPSPICSLHSLIELFLLFINYLIIIKY